MTTEMTKRDFDFSKVYVVFEFEETDGDAIDACSGYAYRDKGLADEHAAKLWGGSVREVVVRDTLPPGDES